MPNLDGPAATSAIRERWSEATIAMMTTYETADAIVKTHLLHIFDKLGVSDRAEAVAQAYEMGVLSS